MTDAARRLLEEALTLSAAERRRLGEALIESADSEGQLSEEWKREILRRIEAARNGTSSLVPGEEVAARVRARLRSAR